MRLRAIRIGMFWILAALVMVARQQGVLAVSGDPMTLEERCAWLGCSQAVQRCMVDGERGLMQCRGCSNPTEFASKCTAWCLGAQEIDCCHDPDSQGICRCSEGEGCGIMIIS